MCLAEAGPPPAPIEQSTARRAGIRARQLAIIAITSLSAALPPEDSLRSENKSLKELQYLQHQLLDTHQAQIKLLESEIAKWKMLYSYQDTLVAHMQSQLEEYVNEKRSLQDEIEKTRNQPEVQLQEGLQRNQWALDCLEGKLTEMRAELEDCQTEASFHVRAALASHVKSGWKVACMLPHELTCPVETVVSVADKDEYLFVEWLFMRSLVRHRHAHLPDKWCKVPNVKILQVEKIRSRTFLKRYMLRRDEVEEERSGRTCPKIRDIKTRIDKKVSERPFEDEVCPCPDSNLNEVLLFHGTTEEKLAGILSSGFDPRLAGMGTGAMFGQGTYFAHNASKCFRYARQGPFLHSGQSRKLRQTVLVARALLGNPFYQSTMCPEQRLPPLGFDSRIALSRAEGGCVDHREYTLYDRGSILPLYIVEFEHQEDCGCCVCTA
ncbi:Tiparp [Symbiodinium natans]|uniref:Poly [ADP-ribose] polymerase n=1 Tax=Symbiodinium natans TaxID=878477 RepID=A0A812Q850_9DINO|nr:Tiparp [Symbiodinium natans]